MGDVTEEAREAQRLHDEAIDELLDGLSDASTEGDISVEMEEAATKARFALRVVLKERDEAESFRKEIQGALADVGDVKIPESEARIAEAVHGVLARLLRAEEALRERDNILEPTRATLFVLDHLRPGALWTNDHTGDTTTITDFASRIERLPDPEGGFTDDAQLVVHHTVNAPPGFTRGYGDDLASFLEHWSPVARAALSPEGQK